MHAVERIGCNAEQCGCVQVHVGVSCSQLSHCAVHAALQIDPQVVAAILRWAACAMADRAPRQVTADGCCQILVCKTEGGTSDWNSVTRLGCFSELPNFIMARCPNTEPCHTEVSS